MKKYRLTKITVKTREILAVSKDHLNTSQTSVCPVCNSRLATILSPGEKQPARLLPANLSDADALLKEDSKAVEKRIGELTK